MIKYAKTAHINPISTIFLPVFFAYITKKP